MANENGLQGMRCPNPKCRSEGPFRIRAEATFIVDDDGTDDYESVEWFDSSTCSCSECEYSATVSDFQQDSPHWDYKTTGENADE